MNTVMRFVPEFEPIFDTNKFRFDTVEQALNFGKQWALRVGFAVRIKSNNLRMVQHERDDAKNTSIQNVMV
jgi:hypothetical protein